MLLHVKEAYTDKIILNCIVYANKIKPTNPIAEINQELYNECRQALKACLAYDGVGIAANQIGIQKSFFLIRDNEDHEKYHVYFNPKYKTIGEDGPAEKEGCLSVPRVELLVKRPAKIKATWLDIVDGKFVPVEKILTDMDARIYLHEIDHLVGMTIIDRTCELNRDGKRELKKRLQYK